VRYIRREFSISLANARPSFVSKTAITGMHDIKGGKTALCDNDTLVFSDYVFECQVKSDENSVKMA